MKKCSIEKISTFALAFVLATSAVFVTSCSSDDRSKDSTLAENKDNVSNNETEKDSDTTADIDSATVTEYSVPNVDNTDFTDQEKSV